MSVTYFKAEVLTPGAICVDAIILASDSRRLTAPSLNQIEHVASYQLQLTFTGVIKQIVDFDNQLL